MRHIDRFSLWTDEFFHVYAAQGLLTHGSPTFPSGLTYDRAILYTKLVATSFSWFGISELSARLPSVLFGILMIPLAYFFGSRLFNRRTGLLSALLIALSPFCILWSGQCRMYTLFAFLYMLAAYLWYLGFESALDACRSRVRAISFIVLSVITLAVSYCVHELTAMFLPTLFFYACVMSFGHCRHDSQQGRGICRHRRLALGFLLSGLVYIVYKAAVGGLASFRSIGAYCSSGGLDGGSYGYYLSLLSRTYPVFIYVFLGAVVFGLWSRHKPVIYAAALFIVPLATLSFCRSWQGYRYLFFVFPFFVVLSAYALTRLAELFLRRRTVLGVVVISLIVIYGTFFPWVRIWSRTFADFGIYNFTAMASTIRSLQGDEILISTEPFLIEHYTGRRPDYMILTQWYTRGYPGYTPLRDTAGREIDINAGIPVLRDVDALKAVENSGRRICVVSNTYFLQRNIQDEALITHITSAYARDAESSYAPFEMYKLAIDRQQTR